MSRHGGVLLNLVAHHGRGGGGGGGIFLAATCSYFALQPGWLSECTASHTAQNNTLWSTCRVFSNKVCIFLICGVQQFSGSLQNKKR